jgi:putative serine protease PepD
LALALDDDPEPEGVSSLDVAPPEVGAATDEPDEGLSQVAAAVVPSVVSITVEVGPGVGQGSGVIISDDGMIVTNNHVVEAAADGEADLSVTFSDGESADAEIVGRDPATDLAVIQAEDVSGLTPATLGTSEQLNVGDTVVAIGSPLGLNGSVTSGIVSAVDRAITLGGSDQAPFGSDRQDQGPAAVIDAIQTDAAINPGNSGGALVNADGEVIGIPTAIASTAGSATAEGGNIGVGFAIAIDDARDIVDQLIDEGEVAHAFLGVEIGDAEGGALVGRVEPGSPADDAGIEEGDLITALDDRDIDDATALTSAVRSHSPDDEVAVTFTRDDDEQTVDVTLGTLPD